MLGSLVNIVGGIIGESASAGDADKANAVMLDWVKDVDALGLPPDLSKPLLYEKLRQVGLYTPELEEKIELQSSKVAQIEEDARLRDAQLSALSSLQERGRIGLTPEERAELNAARRAIAQDAQGKIQGILQQYQARGQGGSGMELAAQLQAAQSGTEQASQEADRMSAVASQRALQAIGESAGQAGRIRSQDFDINKARAEAADEIARFNIQNAINLQQRNIAAKNLAQQTNLQTQQDIANANVALYNRELQRQNEAKADYYKNLLDRLSVRKGAAQAESGVYAGKAADTRRKVAGITEGVSGIVTESEKAAANALLPGSSSLFSALMPKTKTSSAESGESGTSGLKLLPKRKSFSDIE